MKFLWIALFLSLVACSHPDEVYIFHRARTSLESHINEVSFPDQFNNFIYDADVGWILAVTEVTPEMEIFLERFPTPVEIVPYSLLDIMAHGDQFGTYMFNRGIDCFIDDSIEGFQEIRIPYSIEWSIGPFTKVIRINMSESDREYFFACGPISDEFELEFVDEW